MKHLTTLSICLLTVALHSVAQTDVYETKDAEGNAEFTDSPPDANAEVIDLQQTNVVDAPQAQPQQESQPQPEVSEQAPVQENNTFVIHDGNDNQLDDGDEDQLNDGYPPRERALDEAGRQATDQTLDGEAPREVGDSIGQMPREEGDFNAQMPREGEGQVPEDVERYPARSTGAHLR